jgi:hypothetical protein
MSYGLRHSATATGPSLQLTFPRFKVVNTLLPPPAKGPHSAPKRMDRTDRLYTIVQLWKENTFILFYSILFR